MPARTYSTDVYLTCPCPTAKAARSASRCASSAVSHGSPRQPASKSFTSWYPDATTGSSEAEPSSPNRSANHPAGASAANDSGGLSATATAPPHPPSLARRHGQTAPESCRRPPRRDEAPGRTTTSPLGGCASWATPTTTDRPSATVTASRVNPGPRRSTRTSAPLVRKATASASLSRVTSPGSGVNRSTSWVGRSTRLWASIAPPPARATCPASGNAKAIRATCSCSGSRLTRRQHQAEAPTPDVRVAAAIAGARAAAAPRD
jgi:hypothetical protein